MSGSDGYECLNKWLFDVVCYRGLVSTVVMFYFLREPHVFRIEAVSHGVVRDI